MTATTTRSTARLVGLDRLRGGAIVAMVVAHSWLLLDGEWWLRGIVTKPVHLLFLLLLGALFRPGLRPRHLRLAAAAAGATGLWYLLTGVLFASILVVILAAVLVMQVAYRWPALAVVLGLTQGLYWTVPWGGLQPGIAVAVIVAGRALGPGELVLMGNRLPALLEPIGRRPLEWYVGHLALLTVLRYGGVL